MIPAASGNAVRRELVRLLDDYVALHAATGLPRQPFDPQWVSPCQADEPDDGGLIGWRPVPRSQPPDWKGLESALEISLHPDVAAFYGSFWCDCIPVQTQEGGATLIQVWNDRDFDRLVENLLGHALQKRRAGHALTIFVALTDESDFVLSLDNATGTVLLDQPAERPRRKVADSLAELLARMQPRKEV